MKRTGPFLLLLLLGCLFLSTADSFVPSQSRAQDVQFAQDRVDAVQPVTIDYKRVMKYLNDVCKIGPRMSGTPGMKAQQKLLKEHFEQFGAKVELQNFQARQESQDQAIPMTNMIVSWHPNSNRRIILCCHYDTRPIADQEPDPRNWRKPFLSANDGGSGVALLMELAHHMKSLKTKVGVDFVFFDGEEFIFNPKRDRYFFGSQHFAKPWRNQRNRPQYLGAVLFDMIAGKGARFPAEGYSYYRSRALTVQLWQIANKHRSLVFRQKIGEHVRDDHLALQAAGIPATDIIDFSYPHWHRLSDTPENCSAESMDQVARVVTIWMQQVR